MNGLVAAGVALALAAVGSTAVSFEQQLLRSTSTDTQAHPEPVDLLEVDVGSGDVHVMASDAPGVLVHRAESWSFSRPEVTQELDGRTLRLRAQCSGVLAQCSVTYEVRVPHGTRLLARTGSGSVVATGTGVTQVDTGSGDVDLMGTTGDTTARSGSGSVTAADPRGAALSLRTGSGDVVVQGARTPAIRAQTGSGDVVLGLRVPAQRIEARTGSGDVDVMLPPSEDSYDAKVETGSGDSQVRVRTDPASPRSVRVRTGSGDAHVWYAPGR